MISILQKGMLTTIQDLGRRGYQRFGVPVSGAMDWFAASLANTLVGNGENAPLLEVTVIGPIIDISADCFFAVTGAVFAPKLSGAPIPMNECIFAPAGSRLELGFASVGARGYIAFAGGLDVPEDMGSASTYTKAGLGGLNGKPLQNGDSIGIKAAKTITSPGARKAPEALIPAYSASPEVRIVIEPRPDYFTSEAAEIFTGNIYTVAGDSDRMGCRLEGPSIPYAEGCDGNIISDGISIGSIQVAGGRPIILMSDRQTTGGYTKLGAVIMADIPLVAQLKPGEKIKFKAVSVKAAQEAYKAMKTALIELNVMLNV